MTPSVIWITPERQGGIHNYAQDLWPSVSDAVTAMGWRAREPIWPVGRDELEAVISEVAAAQPSIIHIQHEYGFFGGKLPHRYFFPSWITRLRQAAPQAVVVATAHTVLDADFQYSTEGRGWQIPLRTLANRFLTPWLARIWREETWGHCDAVIVHSSHQVASVQSSTRARVAEIPLAVLALDERESRGLSITIPEDLPWVVIFGYLTPEKGQDVAIRAWPRLKGRARLVIAGGVRRAADQRYSESLRALVRELDLEGSVTFTGYLEHQELSSLYSKCALVLAPFRATTGSASVTQAFVRGRAVLASDLPLNRELETRVPGALAFFKSEDPASLATEVQRLLSDPTARERLGAGSLAYADRYSVRAMGARHAELYQDLSGQGRAE